VNYYEFFKLRLLSQLLCSLCALLLLNAKSILFIFTEAGPSGRAVKGVGLRPFACWDRGFESQRGHGRLSVVSVVCVIR